MYKDTVYSAFNLLMHYPPPSGAGQHPQPQPPLVSGPGSPAGPVPATSLTRYVTHGQQVTYLEQDREVRTLFRCLFPYTPSGI